MRALITNDDGIQARGLRVLAEAAVAAGLDVVVAAPHEERSGASASLSALEAGGRLIVDRHTLDGLDGVPAFGVHATPAMISLAAALGAFEERPDVVLSGVNHGPNTGHLTLFSGTVGAGLSANSVGLPALAVSLDIHAGEENPRWETARRAADEALEWFLKNLDGAGDADPYVLNVNVPNVPVEAFRGVREAGLAEFGAVQATVAERGEGYVTLRFSGGDREVAPGTDVDLVRQGWASATALTAPSIAGWADLSSL